MLVDAGLPPLTGTYGQPGSEHATELSHTVTSPAALYTRVFEAQAAALRAQRPLRRNFCLSQRTPGTFGLGHVCVQSGGRQVYYPQRTKFNYSCARLD